MKKVVVVIAIVLMSNVSFAQWAGSSNTSGNTYRYGNVGIGTSSPSQELHIVGSSSPQIKITSSNDATSSWLDLGVATCNGCFSDLATTGDVVLRGAPSGSEDFLVTNPTGGQIIFGTGIWNNEISSMVIGTNGSIGIGTSSFTDGFESFKLSVDGKVRADAVKVYTDWADFVFEADYILPSLKEVEDHIATYGHLKDIPSAKDVEEKGIELGEMNKLLLQKIEELTLYLIEKDKQLDSLQKAITQLEEKINE